MMKEKINTFLTVTYYNFEKFGTEEKCIWKYDQYKKISAKAVFIQNMTRLLKKLLITMYQIEGKSKQLKPLI
jgi:hypothetical protein